MQYNDYLSADLHLDHPGVIEHSKRPFPDLATMQDALIAEINNLPGNGTLYILGDMFVSSKKDPARKILDKIHRKMVFILGNHDKYLDKVFADYGEVHWYLEAKLRGIKLCMQHMPMYEWDRGQYGSLHFHGHTHGAFKGPGKMTDVGWDVKQKILTIEEAITMADANPIFQPCHSKNNGKHRHEI